MSLQVRVICIEPLLNKNRMFVVLGEKNCFAKAIAFFDLQPVGYDML